MFNDCCAIANWLVVSIAVGLLTMMTEALAKNVNTMAHDTLVIIVNRAASADPEALMELANRFERGFEVKANPERSHQIYCQAARLGSIRAQLALARMYLEGKSVTRNQSQASAWLMQAALAGDQVAAAALHAMGPAKFDMAQCDSGPPVRGLQPLPPCNPKDRSAIKTWIRTLAPDYGLDPNLVLTIAALESNFNSDARSSKNAQGIMQLIPETAARFGVRDITNPVENLKGGMAYLRWLMSYFKGNVRLVVAAYNAGEGAVDKHGGIPPYTETQIYVEQVARRYPRLMHPYRPNVTENGERAAGFSRGMNRLSNLGFYKLKFFKD
ncbi:hypothetical protein CCP3SC5AM1_1380005 [Gammaproteobacteria bacterium]